MKYRFTIDEATEKPKKPHVEFEAATEALAYRYIVDEILMPPENFPLKAGTLYRGREGSAAWTPLMVWRRGPGWSFPDGRTGTIEDNRIAPGA